MKGQGMKAVEGGVETYVCDKSGECSIAGTSTLHDWESRIEDFAINAHRSGDLIDADFTVVVKSIKSGRPGMDPNTYKALKESEHPTIRFKAKGLKISNNSLITGFGDLTVAGQTKRIPVEFKMASWVENTMTITGEIKILMTDYGVEPPVALFGTVKTGDEVTFKVNTTLDRKIN
jgi:polyisoprenoid-binding protein YceI